MRGLAFPASIGHVGVDVNFMHSDRLAIASYVSVAGLLAGTSD